MSNVGYFALAVVCLVVFGYLLGNINFSHAFAKAKGVDIYKSGSGNPGTMNMLRNFGTKIAVLTLLFDVLKGLIPAIAAYYLMKLLPGYPTEFGLTVSQRAPAILGYYMSGIGKTAMYIAGFSAFVGHCFPVFHRFSGGKGVATALGVFIACDPIVSVFCFLVGLSYLFFGKYAFVSSFITIISCTLIEMGLAIGFGDSLAAIIVPIVMCIIVIILHRKNIYRLAHGTENNSNLTRRYRAYKAKKAAEKEDK